MRSQISAVTIAVRNQATLKNFYTEVFGWEILMENTEILILKLGETSLSLCSEKLFEQYSGITPGESKNYYFTVSFNLASEIDTLFENFKTGGVKIKKMPAPTFWGGYAGFVTDPEGNLWEINCRM